MTEGRSFNKPVDTAIQVLQPADATNGLQEQLHTMWGLHNGDNQHQLQDGQQVQGKQPEDFGFPFFADFQLEPEIDKCLPRVPTHTTEEQARTAACRLAYSEGIPPNPPNQESSERPLPDIIPGKIGERSEVPPLMPPSPHD